jgi:hypothetical protein
MTGGQTDLILDSASDDAGADIDASANALSATVVTGLRVVRATAEEASAHEEWLNKLEQEGANGCRWRQL